MICQLNGTIIERQLEKEVCRCVLDVQGVGYEAFLTKASFNRVHENQSCVFFISESVTSYDGATTLYGFLTKEEKNLFEQIRDNVGGVGPKKALECLDKISKSLPDFKRAVIENDTRLLVSVFGFTKKTAEKLTFSLKNKIEGWSISGQEKWSPVSPNGIESEALSGLVNLGFKEIEARSWVEQATKKLGSKAKTEDILKESLKLRGGTA